MGDKSKNNDHSGVSDCKRWSETEDHSNTTKKDDKHPEGKRFEIDNEDNGH